MKIQQRLTYNSSLSFIKENWTGNTLNEKQQYINLDGPSERSFADFFKWQKERNHLKPLKRKQKTNIEVVENNKLIKNTDNGFTWLGHATYLFTINKKQFIVDPVLFGVGPLKRHTMFPCRANELKHVDYILLSHNHRDHADKKSMQLLCTLNPHAVILTGLGIEKMLRSWKISNRIVEAGWFQQYQLEEDVRIAYLPAKHWNRRGLTDMNEMLWGSFMIESKEATYYFGADSGLGVHFAEIAQLYPSIDYAFLGIGAYKPEWFMHTAHTSPADVLLAMEQLKARHLVPMHHGTFDLSDEPIYYPKQEMLRLQEEKNFSNVFHLTIGEKLML
ncbi:MAG: MBL fold metallo-hydrolase [Lacibacter sp.]